MALQVTVTGGSGFVAGWLIQQLLEKGYTVHTTVRSAAEGNPKNAHLLRLAAAFSGSLRLFEADLTTPGAFDAAVKGSTYVFHVASPLVFTSPDPQKDIIDMAVQGTENVLAAVAKSKDTVKRVVLTSSTAAVQGGAAWIDGRQVAKNGQLLTEEDFNTFSTVDDEPYYASKYQAEMAAHRWSEREGVSLVAINISLVLGPVLSAETSSTPAQFLAPIFRGDNCEGLDSMVGWVDVRDAARAHILAAETPVVSKRYITGSSSGYNSRFLSTVLRKRFPEYKIAEGTAKSMPHSLDNRKVQRELGVTFRPVEESIIDTYVSLIQVGIVKPEPL